MARRKAVYNMFRSVSMPQVEGRRLEIVASDQNGLAAFGICLFFRRLQQ